jgi:hypothetical protein
VSQQTLLLLGLPARERSGDQLGRIVAFRESHRMAYETAHATQEVEGWVTEKEPRWKRILRLEALAREMDRLGKANLEASRPQPRIIATEMSPAHPQVTSQPGSQPFVLNQGTHDARDPIRVIAEFVGSSLVMAWLISHFIIPLSPIVYPLFAMFGVLYNLPSIIAHSRGHRNRVAITVLNIVGGWSGIAWIGH